MGPATPVLPHTPSATDTWKHALGGVLAVGAGAAAIGVTAYAIRYRRTLDAKQLVRLYPVARVGFGLSTLLGLTWWARTGGRFESFASASVRHALDSIALGLPSSTWNSRDAYRARYTPDQRKGAAFGDAASVALAGVAGYAWMRLGMPAIGRGAVRSAARGGVALTLVGIATAGVLKTVSNARDDGDLGMTLATLGAFGGAAAMRYGAPRAGGVRATVATLLGVLGGGVLGYQVGSTFPVGTGRLDMSPELPHAPALDGALTPLAFVRGAWNHFAEDGPLSIGVTFGKPWREAAAVRERYTTPEVVGGMTGDLVAGALIGTGSLAIGMRVLGRSERSLLRSRLGRLSQRLRAPAAVVGGIRNLPAMETTLKSNPGDRMVRMTSRAIEEGFVGKPIQERVIESVSRFATTHPRWTTELLYGAGLGMFAYTVNQAYNGGRGSTRGLVDGRISAGIAGVGIVGTSALLLAKGRTLARVSPRVRPALAVATSTALWSALMLSRQPIESFVDDAIVLHGRRPVRHPLAAAGTSIVGAVAGALAGEHLSNLFGRSTRVRIVGTAAGAALGAGAGLAFSPLVAS